jgi:hypothetical protein
MDNNTFCLVLYQILEIHINFMEKKEDENRQFMGSLASYNYYIRKI